MKSNLYWDKRRVERYNESEKRATEYILKIHKIYEQANRNIQREIESVYQNYSKDTGIDVQKLKELLTKSETKKHFEELKKLGLDKYVKDNYKSRINRLERLQLELYKKIKDISYKEQRKHTELYQNTIKNGYYKAIYDTQIGTGYDFNFSEIDNNMIKSLMSERWQGSNYSQRIWKNTDVLASQVSDIVGGALLSGQGIEKTARQIRERFGVAKYYASRLARTEMNYFNNQADAMAYEEMGIDKYVYVALLDSRTSEICQDLDNKVFNYKDMEIGVNYPPMHPNCRSTTRGYLGEEAEKLLKRKAKNPITGKYEMIENISYRDWVNKKVRTKTINDHHTTIINKQEKQIDKPLIKPLTNNQKDAINYYVSGDGMYINDYLRDRNNPIERMGKMTELDKNLIKDLDEALDNPIGKDMKLYRSVDASAIFGNIDYSDYENIKDELIDHYYSKQKGSYSEKIYNNIKTKINNTIGKQIEDKGFLSTTKDYNVAKDWGSFSGSNKPVVLELNVPKNIKGRDLAEFDIKGDEQKEVLLARNLKYTIKDITAKDGNIYIKANVISNSDKNIDIDVINVSSLNDKKDNIDVTNFLEKMKISLDEYKQFGKFDPNDNTITEDLSKLIHYDNKPKVISKEEYDKIVSDELVRLIHENRGKSADENYNNTINGEIRYSECTNSHYGRGIYFGTSNKRDFIINAYAGKDNKILLAKLSDDIKIKRFNTQLDWIKDRVDRIKNLSLEEQRFFTQESSLLYMLDGYDGIYIDNIGYYVIYNRGGLIIREE